MLDLTTRLQPCESEVAARVFDGEAIIINLATGSYYSMVGAGGLVWQLIEQHCSLGEIAEQLSAHYDVTLEVARADVGRLIAQLLEHGVVMTSTETAVRGALPQAEQRSAYSSPSLSVFTDMRNLLALDPPMPALEPLPECRPKDPR